jgi:hypothetical protein
MNNEEAKFLLNAYRPGGRDASEPAFGAALEQARNDPALGAWFAREQAHGLAMTAKLREIAPPAHLREAILAGARATKRPVPPSVRRNTTVWFAIAASVAILLAFGALRSLRHPTAAAGELTDFAFDDVVHGRHGGHGPAENALQTHLSAPTTRLSVDMPVNFAALESSGCRTLRVDGHDVLEVCFVRAGTEFHCYIARRDDFSRGVTRAGPEFVERAGLAAAAWSDAGHRFVVVSNAGLDAVKRLL